LDLDSSRSGRAKGVSASAAEGAACAVEASDGSLISFCKPNSVNADGAAAKTKPCSDEGEGGDSGSGSDDDDYDDDDDASDAG
jgi:hypothetical protein